MSTLSPITSAEAVRLAELESKIGEGIGSFMETGAALVTAQEQLGRDEFVSFCLRTTGMHPAELQPAIDLYLSIR